MLREQDEPQEPERHQVHGTQGGRPIGATLDPTIVERARQGDLDAFESIVRDRIGAVYRLNLAIVGNEADASDATQETFIAAWRQIRSLRDPARLEAWLGRIAVNAARMLVRSRGRRAVREIRGDGVIPLSGIPNPGDGVRTAGSDDGSLLAAALGRLDPERRAILALHHLEGRGIPEIAGILGIPDGTAKSRLFSARKALRAALVVEVRR